MCVDSFVKVSQLLSHASPRLWKVFFFHLIRTISLISLVGDILVSLEFTHFSFLILLYYDMRNMWYSSGIP